MSLEFTTQLDSGDDMSSSLSDIWKQFPIKSLGGLEPLSEVQRDHTHIKNLYKPTSSQ